MPVPPSRLLHRLHGHVAGVNWRPTLFAEDVPSSRICALCRMVPKKTLLLPCSHSICEFCLRASVQDGTNVCPLEGEVFTEEECVWFPYPDRKMAVLKAHCWNQSYGCEFVGTLDAVLRHYEAECEFHAVECQQCAVSVLHKELLPHYAAGCKGGAPLHNTDSDCVLSLRDVRAAVEELKAVMRDPHRDQLPALQSQMNQLVEQCRESATRLMETMRLVSQSTDEIKGEVMRTASAAHFTGAENHPSLEGPAEEAEGDFIPWRTEKVLILRRLEMLAKQSVNALEQLRCSAQSDRIHPTPPITMRLIEDIECFSGPIDTQYYTFTLSRAEDVLNCRNIHYSKDWEKQIIWGHRDRCLIVSFTTYFTGELTVLLQWFCLLQSARQPSDAPEMKVLHRDYHKSCQMVPTSVEKLHDFHGYEVGFSANTKQLKDEGFFPNGELRLLLMFKSLR